MTYPTTAASVHIDQPLTNLTIAFLQSSTNFIADRVFPRVSVTKKSDRYYIYNRADFNRAGDVKERSAGTEANTIGMSLSTDQYFTRVYGLAMDFDMETLANEDTALNIRAAGAEVLTTRMLIDREERWADKYFKTGVWGTEYEGVSGTPTLPQVKQWSSYLDSTPIIDVTRARRAMQLKSGGFKPNVMVVGKETRDVLINHPDILERLNGGATVTNTALITDAKLAEIFEVEEFLVMEAVKNDGKEGLAESNSFIGGKSAALYYRPRSSGLMVPSAGYTFTWDELQNASGYGISIKSYTGDFLNVKGIAERIEANLAYDQKVVSADLGVFFRTIVA